MPIKFAVLGAGAWGTAIAVLLSRRSDHQVVLWTAHEDFAEGLRIRRENAQFLPGVPIPAEVEVTADVRRAADQADLWVAAVPTVYLRKKLEDVIVPRLADRLPPRCPVVSLAKGVEKKTFLRPTEILRDVLGVTDLAVLSGPSHAEEVSKGLPTSVVAASEDDDLARRVQRHFSTAHFRVYSNPDLVGVELGGALKNVIGIAAGISDGLGFGDNAKSALLTRGVVEMARFGVAHGARYETFFGLAGVGDLITTCVSRHGRNRAVGERLGKGEKLADILGSMNKMVAEGVFTAQSVYERSRVMGIDMPITAEVYRVLYEDKDPRAAVTDLMTREPRGEQPW